MKRILPTAAGLLMAAVVTGMQLNRGFPAAHAVSDGCFAAGVMLAGIGILCFVANKGLFDLAFYGLSKTLPVRQETFLEYKKRKRAHPKEVRPFLIPGFLLLVMAAAVLL